MGPIFESSSIQVKCDAATPALLFHIHEDDPRLARVTAAQQILFPAQPRRMCDELGLNWWAALKLYEDGWLSFSPNNTQRLDESQEAELRFVATLVMGGCDRNMLTVLLCGLQKPYAYDLKKIYYDWTGRRWKMTPDPRAHPEAVFTDWLESLVQKGDAAMLSGIAELAHDALQRVDPSVIPTAPKSNGSQLAL